MTPLALPASLDLLAQLHPWLLVNPSLLLLSLGWRVGGSGRCGGAARPPLLLGSSILLMYSSLLLLLMLRGLCCCYYCERLGYAAA